MTTMRTMHNTLRARQLHAIKTEIRNRVIRMSTTADVSGAEQLSWCADVATHYQVGSWMKSHITVCTKVSTAIFTISTYN